MNRKVEFGNNRATEEQIATHLVLCDSRFVPPLSSRVEINEYAQKIYTKAMRFEAWAGGALIGLVAIYCDNHCQRLAYITSVSVLATPLATGIASQLLATGIDYLRDSRFEQVDLEVDIENQRAIRLYDRHGFLASKSHGRTLLMRLILGEELAL
jgi:ribosomal protein S18 acetylase RimI-like enzyme